MASHSSLLLPHSCHYPGRKTAVNAPHSLRFIVKEQGKYSIKRESLSFGFLYKCYTSSSSRYFISCTLSSSASPEEQSSKGSYNDEKGFNRANCLVDVLHESATNFSLAVESLSLVQNGPELAMAWIGKDVHQWHKRMSYQVAVYTLMKTAIDVEILLSHERTNDSSPVRNILTPKANLLGKDIESQLNSKHPLLLNWFVEIELPRIAGFFVPLLKKWSMEYAGSGVAGIVVAMSCCAAVGKLYSGHYPCPFEMPDEIFIELMKISYNLVSVDKLHKLSIEAGFEHDFLNHFGKKVFPNKKSEELIEFWIGLAQEKLSLAFQQESLISGQPRDLATLGLFAYLGRKTRLFISKMGIKDLDEPVMDFLSYLECGSLFIYPELSSIRTYQLFIEIVTDEIGWLDFYGEFNLVCPKERKSKKNHAIQAEKEIILSAIFTTCYDFFSGFAHLNRSTQQLLDAKLLSFLLRSQSLLTICMEDYWAAYDKSSLQIMEVGPTKTPTKLTFALEAPQQKSSDLMTNQGWSRNDFGQVSKQTKASTTWHMKFIKKYSMKLASTSSDVFMGTRLLFMDFKIALELLTRQLHGRKITERERKKLKETLNDFISLIPVTILMLLPVSAIGHAAILAAIKKYMPYLIPSPYSSERLDTVKQLQKTKKMAVQSWIKLEDPSSFRRS